MLTKDSRLEARVEKLEKALEQALCDHDYLYINYMRMLNDDSANPEYQKECGACGKQFTNVLSSTMYAEIAAQKRKEAEIAEAASRQFNSGEGNQ